MVLAKQSKNSVFRNVLDQQYDTFVRYKLFKSVKGSLDYVQRLGLFKVLPIHTGCVNCICWNDKGDKLLSGSDDQHLAITHPYTFKVLTDYKSSHRANIFSAKFLPCTDDTGIVSCSGDGMILYSNVNRLDETRQNIFNCHIGTTYEVATVPDDPHTFLSCGEDCTVRYFDLRIKDKCNKTRCREDILISNRRPVTALCVNPLIPYQLAIGCSDSTVRLYDRRMLSVGSEGEFCKPYDYFRAPGMDEGRFYRITSLSYSPKGEDILVSYSSEHLYLFSLSNKKSTVFSAQPTSEDLDSSCDSGGSSSSSTPVAPVRRLRLRGDWSDTGPDARPQNDTLTGGASNARPTLHGTLMQRMTDVLSRMLNDPATRAALSQGGEDSFPETEEPQSMQSEPSAQNSEAQEGGSVESNRQNSTEDCPPTGLADDGRENAEETSPIDLPLPSFSSTYSTYVKPIPEDEPSGSGSAEAVAQSDDKDESGPSTSHAPPAKKRAQTKVRGHFKELSNEYEDLLHSQRRVVEPMVNLTYSAVGSTASSISLFVDEDSSRTTPKSPEASTSQGAPSQEASTTEDAAAESPDHTARPCPPELYDNSSVSESEVIDDDYAVSDDDFSVSRSPHCPPGNVHSRLVHPIERHMDDAVYKARSSKDSPGPMGDDENVKTSRNSGELKFKQKFTGHRNSRTMIKEATFWGDDYIISGSDCGHIFMWERDSAKLVMLLEADNHVVNCVQPHPFLPILASSGIDYNVKLWSPIYEESAFDVDLADELVKRNAIMLEETRDTITVPASFMIRMLACLNQIRRGGRGRHQQRRESNANSD